MYINVLIDQVKIYVKAGNGGNGIVSFRREKYVPFGGPDGGDGGNGASIYLEGDSAVTTLQTFRHKKQFRAESGAHGKGKDMHGRNGRELVLKVPLGTIVRTVEGDEHGHSIVDIKAPGQRALVANGGVGGAGNARFASSTNQAPRQVEEGEKGDEHWLLLDLKLIADVGIAGYPNVGKSTLLSVVSNARPKIANYPFTTLEPNVGVVEVGYRSFVLADIPGLVEGAHRGVGLGLDFLRHIERTRVIIHLVDGSSEDPVTELQMVEKEMASYGAGLQDKARIVAVNKLDIPEVRERQSRLKQELGKRVGEEIHFISAATGEGVEGLMKQALEIVSLAPTEPQLMAEEEQFKVFRPRPVTIEKKRRGVVKDE